MLHKIKRNTILQTLAVTLIMGLLTMQSNLSIEGNTYVRPALEDFIVSPDQFQVLTETETMIYAFKDRYDVMSLTDKRTGYVWKTGLDIPFDSDIEDACDAVFSDPEATSEMIQSTCIPLEAALNTLYEGIANSVLTLEYFSSSLTINFLSSGDKTNAVSTLKRVVGSNDTFALEVDFFLVDIQTTLYIKILEDGLNFSMPFEELGGQGLSNLAGFQLLPFLGATGGAINLFDPDTGRYNKRNDIPKPMGQGYMFVPDGPGSLIEFKRNSTRLNAYVGDVYGVDYSQQNYYYANEPMHVPLKNPTMPVFGAAHTEEKVAFVGYAEQGAEYMSLNMYPHNNRTQYNYIYPRFSYNGVFTQVYSQTGSGFDTLFPNLNRFSFSMTYRFLADHASSFTPDYSGMANIYREHLIEQGLIKSSLPSEDSIGLRVDLLMADSMKSIIGTQDVVVTNIRQVEQILNELNDMNLGRLSSGLLGYARGGKTLMSFNNPSFDSSIGTAAEFASTMANLKSKQIEVSLMQDYSAIYEQQMLLIDNAAKHINGWYNRLYLLGIEAPVQTQYYPRPTKVKEWFLNLLNRYPNLTQHVSLQGISNELYSDYSSENNPVSVTDVIQLYEQLFSNLVETRSFDMVRPNLYLLPFTKRYLNMSVFPSQHLIQTEMVPFISLVLQNSLELYGPYVNFSFYTPVDILTMIDYQLFPSFMITNDPSFKLVSTLSSVFYSTEFELYRTMIESTYHTINHVLSKTLGDRWIRRETFPNQTVINHYASGSKVLINYASINQTIEGLIIPAQSAVHVRGPNHG